MCLLFTVYLLNGYKIYFSLDKISYRMNKRIYKGFFSDTVPKADWGIDILSDLSTSNRHLNSCQSEAFVWLCGMIKYAATSDQNGDFKSDASNRDNAPLSAL